jgi:hypothetical protein
MSAMETRAALRLAAQAATEKYLRTFDTLHEAAVKGNPGEVSAAAGNAALCIAETLMGVATSGVPEDLVKQVVELANVLQEGLPDKGLPEPEFRAAVIAFIARVRLFHEEAFRIILPGPTSEDN